MTPQTTYELDDPTHAARRLSQGETTSLALTQDMLARAQTGEGPRVFTRLYTESALAEAQESDRLRAAGLVRSPLEGLPVSVKDLFDVAGYATRAGSRLLESAPVATATAEVVQRLRRAGAVIVGSTNMTEFAFSGLGLNPHFGTPRNPWQRSGSEGRIPGGSSSGAAISVTDDMALGAVGTDTGGSVRIPAALCGLVGFKPTARRVPQQGVLPLSTSMDSIGPLAHTVGGCIAMDAVLSGENHADLRPADVASLKLFAPSNWVLDGMDETVAAAWERALRRLSAAGAHITTARLAPLDELAGINAQGGLAAAESWAWHRHFLATRASEYDPRVSSRIVRGREISAADYIDLLARRRSWIGQVSQALSGFDGLIMPTVPVVAPRISDLDVSTEAYFAANGLILRNPSTINFLDGCAVSLPCHSAGEAPVGFGVAALGGQDASLLAMALALEPVVAQG